MVSPSPHHHRQLINGHKESVDVHGRLDIPIKLAKQARQEEENARFAGTFHMP
jgi:hypothetical protein